MTTERAAISGQVVSSGPLLRAARWLSDHWIDLGVFTLPVLVSILSVFANPIPQPLVVLFAIVLLLGFVALLCFYIRRSTRVSSLQEEIGHLNQQLQQSEDNKALLIDNAQSLCEGFLQDLAQEPLNFGSGQNNSERITLYVHDSERSFQPVGRFSFNQRYIKRGRTRYPDNQGCIAKAWENGWDFRIVPDPEVDLEGWKTECRELGLPKTTVDNLKMRSSLYCACAVYQRGSGAPSGVVVIECTDPNRYSEAHLKTILTEDRCRYIASLIEMIRPYLGDMGQARREGF